MACSMGQPTMRLAVVGFLVLVSLVPNKVGLAQVPVRRAWDTLEQGQNSRNTRERINAVSALAELPGDAHAAELAEAAIADKNADVRAAAALTLGRIGSVRSIPLLKEALKDKDTKVAFAASSGLLGCGDSSGYAVYREVLVGKRKSGEGPVEEEKKLVKDPKAMTMMMLGVAIGFAPYAGYGWATFEVLSKDYGGPVRVEAAQKLANDPDPETREALVQATSNKNWKVRVAALEALAQRADPGLLDALMPHLSDKNQAVRCAAAVGIIRLSAAREPEVQLSRTRP